MWPGSGNHGEILLSGSMIRTILDGLERDPNSYLAALCLLVLPVLAVGGYSEWSFMAPLVIYFLYTVNRQRIIIAEIRAKELEYDRDRDLYRLEIDRRLELLLKENSHGDVR